ncbi:MAG: galactokinase [Bryobacterales bacterium]|nr:galactokinase [Bryobacterales bacterium]
MKGPRTFRAPGRVNLIGEHTDYNLGFVLPIALHLSTYVETSPSPDGLLRISSEFRNITLSWAPEETATLEPRKQWTDYVAGVARELALLGVPLEALELKIRSDVPEGSGLSSSAALEVSSALAFLQGREFDRLELARLCQRAETGFVGLPSGIMDQYVSLFGQPRAAIRIDCRSLEHITVTLPDDVQIIAINSMVKHELGASAYRIRVQECAIASEAMGVASLRDATLAMILKTPMPGEVRKRARHVVTENLRVESFVEAAAAGDLARMGQLFVESHRSMQQDYAITADEVDFLVDEAITKEGCYGARMTGGGFGGCTVNLVAPAAVDAFEQAMRDAYKQRFNIDPNIFRCIPGPGAAEITK